MDIFEAMTNKSPNQNMKIDPYTYPTFSNEPFSNPEALPDVYDHAMRPHRNPRKSFGGRERIIRERRTVSDLVFFNAVALTLSCRTAVVGRRTIPLDYRLRTLG